MTTVTTFSKGNPIPSGAIISGRIEFEGKPPFIKGSSEMALSTSGVWHPTGEAPSATINGIIIAYLPTIYSGTGDRIPAHYKIGTDIYITTNPSDVSRFLTRLNQNVK
jgi:hypothetical protein